MSGMITVAFTLNGEAVRVETSPARRALDLLREDLGLTAAKEGCGHGECGACAVLVDGVARLSCLMLAAQLEGREVVTAEGLGTVDNPHPLQASFAAAGAVQCGYCTPGMTVAAAELLARIPDPDRSQAREAVSGNLCRCTGYVKIVDAVLNAATALRQRADDENVLTATLGQPDAATKGQPGAATQRHPGAAVRGGRPMTPDVRCPRSLAELWPLLDDGYAAMAGGTDLLARRGACAPPLLACLERIESLCGVREEDGFLRIGACETHARLLRHPLAAARLPVLAQALKTLGSPLVRNMGTIGGNIVTASPAGDTLPPLYALDAAVELTSRQGARRLPLTQFIQGPGRTALLPGEIVSAVLAAPVARGAVSHFEKVGLRNALAISVVSLAAVIECDAAGTVTRARLAYGSVAPTPIRCGKAESVLTGNRLDRETLLAGGEAVRDEISPIDDLRATAAYRREVAGNILLRLSLF